MAFRESDHEAGEIICAFFLFLIGVFIVAGFMGGSENAGKITEQELEQIYGEWDEEHNERRKQ